jgi:hypothetical protein
MMAEDSLDNESPDMKRDAEVMKIIEQYAELDAESKDLSERRATLRAKAEKDHDISSHALQDAVYKLKKQTKAERLADERSTRMIIRAVEGRQMEFPGWQEQIRRNEKRESDKRRRAAEAAAAASGETPEQQERRLAGDTNPRSDPKRGGAGKAKAKKASKKKPTTLAPVVEDQRTVEEAEQESGGATISSLMPQTEAAKQSQSAIAQQKLADAGLDKPTT